MTELLLRVKGFQDRAMARDHIKVGRDAGAGSWKQGPLLAGRHAFLLIHVVGKKIKLLLLKFERCCVVTARSPLVCSLLICGH